MDNKIKKLAIRIELSTHKDLKIYLAKKGITLQNFIEGYIKKTVKENK